MFRQVLRTGNTRLRSCARSSSVRALTNQTCRRLRLNSASSGCLTSNVKCAGELSRRHFASSADLPEHVKVVLPALSPTMEMGTIVSWEKKEGDALSEGDLLAEIETDKATMGFETPEEGYLAKILIPAGTKNVPLGKLLCIIVQNESDVAAFKDFVDSGETVQSPKTSAPAAQPSVVPSAPAPTPTSVSAAPVVASTSPASTFTPGQRIFISPLAKQMAAAKGLDITQLAGSGPSGRIRAVDVLSAQPSVLSSTSGTSTSAFTDQPLSGMRSTIARRLSESKSTIPHYYLTVDIEVNELVKLREQMNALLSKESKQSKLSLNDFIIKAAALSCKQVPDVNSSWQDTHIRQYESVDISLAVSTDAGLITPIVFSAEKLGVSDISNQVKELANKAREGRLQPNEYQGGTFTISNLGMFGVGKFSAVINPPQSAILAVGSIEQRLVPNTSATTSGSESSSDKYRTAQILTVTLSCDHRVIDGAVGARWLQHFTRYLSNPFSMVL